MTTPDRPLDLEVEVPGTPEQVWDAIATGPGISSWIHPTTVEEREGGTFTFDMGTGPQSGTVTAWEPPHRFAQETSWGGGDEMPATVLATEWIVEARSGGTCLVRMVTSGFGTGGDWADEYDGFAESMTTALANLRLYLTHFPGQTGRRLLASGASSRHRDDAWTALLEALGLAEAAEGDLVEAGGPGFRGVVERSVDARWRHDLLLRLERPHPGLAALSAWGAGADVAIQLHMFDADDATVEAWESEWQIWLDAHLGAGG